MFAVPINKKESIIEGLGCVASLTDLRRKIDSNDYVLGAGVQSMEEVGVSIVTPPHITLEILREGYANGVRSFLLQPGTYDNYVDAFMQESVPGAVCIKGCVLVELGFDENH